MSAVTISDTLVNRQTHTQRRHLKLSYTIVSWAKTLTISRRSMPITNWRQANQSAVYWQMQYSTQTSTTQHCSFTTYLYHFYSSGPTNINNSMFTFTPLSYTGLHYRGGVVYWLAALVWSPKLINIGLARLPARWLALAFQHVILAVWSRNLGTSLYCTV